MQALLAAPALTNRSLARHQGAFGDPVTPWGSLVVEPDERKRQASLHAWTRRHGCSSWPPGKRTPAGWRSFRTPRPADDTAWEQAAQAWASFLAEQALALEVPPVAGFVADDMRADSRTPFELAVDLVAEEVLGTDLLRQYSWLTLVGSGALQRLGGVTPLRESGAFTSVTPCRLAAPCCGPRSGCSTTPSRSTGGCSRRWPRRCVGARCLDR